MARPKDCFPTYSWPNHLRQADRRPKSNGRNESQGEGDEGREGSGKTGTFSICAPSAKLRADFWVILEANTSYQG